MVRVLVDRLFFLRMCLNPLSKAVGNYRKQFTYLKNRVTTNQKYTLDSQKPETELEIIKPQKEKQKEGKWTKKNYENNWKTRIKMAISTYPSIL